MQQKHSDCTEIEDVIAELIMFLWTASKLAAPRASYPRGFFFSKTLLVIKYHTQYYR